jgi:2-succinyl-5-enolpyruvyl-6-hydroxy-3-cyclohexene-1-carboxylate synthase
VTGLPENNSSPCARVVIEELISRGVRDVVLAPGSRNAPLAYQVFEADRVGRLRLHVRIDERTAGFLALGLAKGSDLPVAVVTTSGTAAANLHPAVLEAWHSHLPLLVITADRPRSMINTGANQTTQQDQLFTSHVRAAAQLTDEARDSRWWRFEVSRLAVAAQGLRSRLPGPVHLNMSLSEPLTPEPAAWIDREELPVEVGELAQPHPADPHQLQGAPRTVVVVGDCRPAIASAALDLASAGGFPVLAEPSSNARRGPEAISCYRLLLGTALADDVERVVVFGHPTLSRPVSRLLARPDVELIMVSPYADWVDPGRRVPLVVDAVGVASPRDHSWLDRWTAADTAVQTALDQLLNGERALTGPELARAVWTGLSDHDALLAGSSNPVRDLDLAPITPTPPLVYANRGLSGIDGTISSAIGVALGCGRPVHALVGDLTFLHDSTGLIFGADEPQGDVRIVVANDGGGSIFATLEQGLPEFAAAFERVFATPHDVDLEPLVSATGAAFTRVGDLDDLSKLLGTRPSGIEVVEVRIDRSQRRALDLAMQALAESV